MSHNSKMGDVGNYWWCHVLSYNLMIKLKLAELEITRTRFQMLARHKQGVSFLKNNMKTFTVWKVSKYGPEIVCVFDRNLVDLKKNSVFGHFSCSGRKLAPTFRKIYIKIVSSEFLLYTLQEIYVIHSICFIFTNTTF